jgi:hypothetical protein
MNNILERALQQNSPKLDKKPLLTLFEKEFLEYQLKKALKGLKHNSIFRDEAYKQTELIAEKLGLSARFIEILKDKL